MTGSRLEREVQQARTARAGPVVHASEEEAGPELAQLPEDAPQWQGVFGDIVVESEARPRAVERRSGLHPELREAALQRPDAPTIRSSLPLQPLSAPEPERPAQGRQDSRAERARQTLESGEIDLDAAQLASDL